MKIGLISIIVSILFCQIAFCGQIEGNVTDASGSPIPSVTVRAYDFSTNSYDDLATTDSSGHYSLTYLSAGDYRIYIPPQNGYLEQYYDNVSQWDEASPVSTTDGQTTPNIDFVLIEGGKIRGTVTDSVSSSPLSGIVVYAYNSDDGSYATSTGTAADGSYTLASLKTGNYRVCIFEQQNYIRQFYDNTPIWDQALPLSVIETTTTSGIDFALVEGNTLSGNITKQSDGSPFANTWVYLFDYANDNQIAYVENDQAGDYTFNGIAPGTYYLRVYSNGDLAGQYYDNVDFKSQATPITVFSGENIGDLDFALFEGGKISGTVTDSSTGLPLYDAYIEVTDFSDNYYGYSYTDADGNYTVSGLNAGTYRIAFHHDDYVFQFYSNKSHHHRAEANPVVVTIEATTSEIDFSVVPGGSISGKVLDPYGSPIQSAWISVHDYYNNGDHINSAWTDSNGDYTITQMPPGSFEIRVESWSTGYPDQYYENSRHPEGATPVVAGLDEDVFGIDFNLEAGATINGTITGPDGTPVENVEVQCFGDNTWFDSSMTDNNGQYTLTGIIPDQSWTVAAYPPPGSEHMITAIDRFIPAGTTDGVDIQLDPNGFTISGTVTDKTTGLPVPNINVGCHIDESPYNFWGGSRKTDENGYYELNGLPLSEIDIFVETWDYPQYAGAGAEVQLTGDLTIDFELGAPSNVSGYVIDMHTGEPIANVAVEIWNDINETGDTAVTDSDGYFYASGLSPGISEVIAMPHTSTGYAWSMPCPSNWIDIPEGADIENRYIAIQKGALVTGRFVMGDGTTPISHAKYDLTADWTEVWGINSGANGEFEIRLPIGNYGIAIEIDDDIYSNYFQTVNITDLTTPVSLGDIKMYSDTDGGQISGTFLNSAAFDFPGDIVALALIEGTTITPDNWNSYWDRRWGEFTPTGDLTITSLPPGNYDIYLLNFVELPNGRESGTVRDIVYDVPVGATGIVLEYDSEGGTVSGSVDNNYGEIIVGCSLMLVDQSTGKFAAFAEGTPDGQYSINNVEPGNYTLTALHTLYQPVTRTITVTEGAVTAVAPITLDFAGIRQGADISGDGIVDISDLAAFANQWLGTGPESDFDADGIVNLADLEVISRMWMSKAIWRN